MAVKKPKTNTKNKKYRYITVDTTSKEGQLFDPFYKELTSSYAKAHRNFMTKAENINDLKNAYEKEQKRVKAGKARNSCWIYGNRSIDELFRLRAYEFAYFSFKKEIRSDGGDNYGVGISKSDGDYESFQKVGGASGQAWCAQFIGWCYYMAGWDPIPISGIAGATNWAAAINQGTHIRGISPEKAKAGDTVVFNWTGSHADHVGMFSQWLILPSKNRGVGLFTTIEGNTGSDNEVILTDGKLSYGSGGGTEWGVFGKKHIYHSATGSISMASGETRTATFSRIYS